MDQAFDFSGLTADELTTLRTNALAGLNVILNLGQSYTMMGRSFSKANISELSQVIAAINSALEMVNGQRVRFGYANVNL